MNKKVFTLLTILFLGIVPFSMSAREISQKQAEKVAQKFFSELKANAQRGMDEMTISETFTTSKNGEVVYYAFNFENGGFVIVAADDTYEPIIGYSDKFAYSNVDVPANFEYWMNTYAEDIIAVRNQKQPSKYTEQWSRYLNDEPAIKGNREDVVFLDCAIWNQDDPYNYYAPITPDGSGPGGRCYAGCVSTAMEMCMNYWRWPLSGEGSNSYSAHSYPYDNNCQKPHQAWNWGTLSANFSQASYDWYNSAHTPGNKFYENIAYLMYHCGISVDMTYDPCGSGSQSSDAAIAFKNNFKYATNTTYAGRTNTAAWIALLKEELNSGRILYYSGHSASGGHAFVCDGYDNADMFHFNFGWSGSGNGYFSVQVGPDGYNNNQGVIKNLQPNTAKGYPYYCSGNTIIKHSNGSVEDGSGPLEDYQNNTDASWLINPMLNGDSVKNLKITWRKLQLASGDYLKFYDGVDANAPLIKSFTANSLPTEFTVESGKVFVTFTTDGSETSDGFHFEYTTTAVKYCNGNTYVDENGGTITDGSPTNCNYANSSNCMYIFNRNKQFDWIKFNFRRCQLADGDYIVFRRDNEITDTIMGSPLQMPEINFFNIKDNYISVHFISDSKFNDKGFEIEFTTNKTAVEEFEAVSDLSVYPNPASNSLKINFQAEKTNLLELTLYSITGQTIFSTTHNNFSGNFNTTLDVSQYPKGIYLLNIRTDKGVSTRKVVVQ